MPPLPARIDDVEQHFAQLANFQNDTQVSRRIAAQECERILAFGQNPVLIVVTENADQDELQSEVAGL